VAITLDPVRIAQLREVFSTTELSGFIDDVAHDLSRQIDVVTAAGAAEDFTSLYHAAHRGRNHALQVGARELAGEFEALELAARDDRGRAAREAVERIWITWPPTRAAIQRLSRTTTE
jgi:hypothetical protein